MATKQLSYTAEEIDEAIGRILNLSEATEVNEGLESAFDKKLLDHSLHNVAFMGSYNSAENSINQLISEDAQYSPKNGQFLGWQDINGKKHLSRYLKVENWDFPLSLYWSDIVYDDVHGTFVALARSNNPNSPAGGFSVAVRTFNSAWKYINQEAHEEWKILTYGNGIFCAVSGNYSAEYEISTDGGYTWEFKTLPHMEYWVNCRYTNGKFYFISHSYPTPGGSGTYTNISVISTTDFINFTTETYPSGCIPIDLCIKNNQTLWLLKRISDNKFFVKNDYAERNLNYALVAGDSEYTRLKVIDDMALCVGENGLPSDSYDYHAGMSILNNIWNGSIQEVSSLLNGVPIKGELCKDKNGNIRAYLLTTSTILGCQFEELKINNQREYLYSWPNNSKKTILCIWKNYAIIAEGCYSNYITNKGTSCILYDLEKQELVVSLDRWEEIPQIPEGIEGILCVQDKNVLKTEIEEPYLNFEENTLKANVSDRYTQYLYYRLESYSNNQYKEIWCKVPRGSIVNNSTKVYSNEACTTEIGVISNHNYNLNQLEDTEVSINGETFVYKFIDSKTPLYIATTKSIIDAISYMKQYIDSILYQSH